MDWEHLRHFSALAGSGSLSAAARLLEVEHATVARRVSALEKSLGLKLVDRRGRRITLTSEGHRIVNIIARMELGALEIQRVVGAVQSEPKGEVTISAPPAFAAAVLMPPLVALHRRYPGLKLNIIGEIRKASLEKREADIALRLSRPEEGDLSILRLGQIEFEPYASAKYLQETAEPDWCFIGYGHQIDQAVQQHALESFAAGRRFTLFASTIELQLAAARAGAGIAMLPSFLTINDDTIIKVCPDMAPSARDVWLVVHADLKDAAPIRAVIDALRAAILQRAARPEIVGKIGYNAGQPPQGNGACVGR